ncbi:hypothetical protein AWB81_06262 [Caballeronia arationis]|uniref:TPM domain-containing protein n=1 Tax=Caballeronia arationis TaxID=1777142 RepID=UPI00074CC071|nr:TPM domain-containing protein [Caballeronia arationis]SAL02701.1 hypothetical protein AWB81_06262 [Caballeronia arationis]
MDLKRVIRHLFLSRWHVNAAFPSRTLHAIGKAVQESHRGHIGQVRFVVEGALRVDALVKGASARERAIDVFSELRVWDTEHNNGVLIYLLLADRDVEIVADRGVHAKVHAAEWEAICQSMEAEFRSGRYETGVLRGVEQVTELLRRHFPQQDTHSELPSKPEVM